MYGASVRSVDTSGRSALVWSVVSGQEDCVRVMIEAGADPRTRDSRGRTAAHVAAAHGQVIVLGTLLGIDSSSLSNTDKDGYTPLHYAAYHGQTAALEMMLQSETIVTTDSASSFSPLHCALVSGHEQCVQILLSQSHSAVNSPDSAGLTPLHIAA